MPNNFDYNLGIPNPPNNPSNDVPLMQINTNSISSLISVDHVGFKTNGSGIHRQVTLLNEAAPGLGDGNGVFYANSLNGNSWPIWQNALGSFALMSQASSAVANGFVSLPSGILMQWGTISPVVGQTLTAVNFNIPFPTACFIVLVTEKRTGTPNNVDTVYINAKSQLSFSYYSTSNGGFVSFDWLSIGN
jgi:hypothetical protein